MPIKDLEVILLNIETKQTWHGVWLVVTTVMLNNSVNSDSDRITTSMNPAQMLLPQKNLKNPVDIRLRVNAPL